MFFHFLSAVVLICTLLKFVKTEREGFERTATTMEFFFSRSKGQAFNWTCVGVVSWSRSQNKDFSADGTMCWTAKKVKNGQNQSAVLRKVTVFLVFLVFDDVWMCVCVFNNLRMCLRRMSLLYGKKGMYGRRGDIKEEDLI